MQSGRKVDFSRDMGCSFCRCQPVSTADRGHAKAPLDRRRVQAAAAHVIASIERFSNAIGQSSFDAECVLIRLSVNELGRLTAELVGSFRGIDDRQARTHFPRS
jgi:hypothetical protein